MSKGRILVVEDDFDISNMLRIYCGAGRRCAQGNPQSTPAVNCIGYHVARYEWL
jgi:hypothetical protein